jgi:hypothetical protein
MRGNILHNIVHGVDETTMRTEPLPGERVYKIGPVIESSTVSGRSYL